MEETVTLENWQFFLLLLLAAYAIWRLLFLPLLQRLIYRRSQSTERILDQELPVQRFGCVPTRPPPFGDADPKSEWMYFLTHGSLRNVEHFRTTLLRERPPQCGPTSVQPP